MRIGPKFKICRRLGERVFPKAMGPKFTISGTERRTTGKKKGRGGLTEYGQQLLEKQKAKYTYGVSEKQFSNYVKKTRTIKNDSPAKTLLVLLETRLDNCVYRLGWTKSRAAARQAVGHGHIWVNGRRVTIPSYQVKAGDKLSIRKESQNNGFFRELADKLKEAAAVPVWLSREGEGAEAIIKALPTGGERESNLNFNSILEFYSRV